MSSCHCGFSPPPPFFQTHFILLIKHIPDLPRQVCNQFDTNKSKIAAALVVSCSPRLPFKRRHPGSILGWTSTQGLKHGCIKYFIFWDQKANENIFFTQTLGILCFYLNLIITKQDSVYLIDIFQCI